MNDGSFFLYIYFRARVRPLLPTHIHRALPNASIGSDRFRAACLPACRHVSVITIVCAR